MKVKQPVKPEAPAAAKPTAQVPAVRQTTDVALPAEWQNELAAAAKDEAAVEAPAMQSFSLRSGVLSYNGNPMPDNEMRVIVVASAFEHAMFISKFDPNNIVPPLCFAISPDGEDMEPHENAYKPQGGKDDEGESTGCLGCPMLEWGSDPSSPSGRGKMCKEVRRLAVIPEQAMLDGELEKTQAALLRVPVTSVANWGNYVHLCAATMKRPPWAVVTLIKVIPSQKNQFEVKFEAVDAISDVDALTSIKGMRDSMQKAVMTPYSMMTEEQYKDATEEKPAKKRKF